MKYWSNLKSLVFVLFFVAAGLLIWCCRERWDGFTSIASPQAQPTSQNKVLVEGSTSNNAANSPLLPTDLQSSAGSTRSASTPRPSLVGELGLFNENARALMRSSEPSKVDYGRMRLKLECLSFSLGGNGTELLRDYGPAASKPKGAYALIVGDASDAARMAGFSRSLEKCRDLYGGVPLTVSEIQLIDTLPTGTQYRAIRQTLIDSKDFDSAETKAALSQVVTGPMFGALSSLLATSVDYSDLLKSYRPEQVDALYLLAIPMVLCRMGDDCDRGGIVTDQLCWTNGICGDRVEEAIFANLRNHGLDTTAFSQFIFKVHQALLTGDTSIFRKQKPSK